VNGRAHRAVAVATWLTAAPHAGVTHPGHLAAGAAIALACGHGHLSPDADHPAVAPLLARLVPGGHRGILHWPPIPAALWWAAPLTGVYAWQVLAVALSWASHLAADLICGELPWWPRRGRRGGWHRWGLGLATGGRFERWVALPLALTVSCWATATTTLPLAAAHLPR
jgi:hypothetical protein